MSNDAPRLAWSHLPTPIEPLPRLTAALGGPRLFVKRDDCTGVALGGNKCRKLEYLVADALGAGADTLITVGGIQSNHVRQSAGFAARAGLACEAVLEPVLADPSEEYRKSGNVLLDGLFGARLHYLQDGEDTDAALARVTDAARTAGRRPYVIPMGGSNAVGCMGYVRCADEIALQATAMGIDFDHVVLATGSCGTQAGLVAGFWRNHRPTRVLGFSVSDGRERKIARIDCLVRETLAKLGSSAPSHLGELIHLDDGYFGRGYGFCEPRALEAVRITAASQAILLDPVYSGKAMAGLIDHVRRGSFTPQQNILFLHTGGSPALFAYRDAFDVSAG